MRPKPPGRARSFLPWFGYILCTDFRTFCRRSVFFNQKSLSVCAERSSSGSGTLSSVLVYSLDPRLSLLWERQVNSTLPFRLDLPLESFPLFHNRRTMPPVQLFRISSSEAPGSWRCCMMFGWILISCTVCINQPHGTHQSTAWYASINRTVLIGCTLER